jgi:hypothetical protein
MLKTRSIYGLFALSAALIAGFSASARAEFFGCKDDRGRVLSSWTTSSGVSGPSYARNYSRNYTPARSHYSADWAAQPSRSRYHARRDYRW